MGAANVGVYPVVLELMTQWGRLGFQIPYLHGSYGVLAAPIYWGDNIGTPWKGSNTHPLYVSPTRQNVSQSYHETAGSAPTHMDAATELDSATKQDRKNDGGGWYDMGERSQDERCRKGADNPGARTIRGCNGTSTQETTPATTQVPKIWSVQGICSVGRWNQCEATTGRSTVQAEATSLVPANDAPPEEASQDTGGI